MRRSAFLQLVCMAVALAGSPRSFSADKPVLSLYTYDSLIAKGGLGPEIFPLFSARCGCELRPIAVGDGAQLVNRLALDARRGQRGAAIVLGLDEPTWEQAKPWLSDWGKWVPKGAEKLSADLRGEPGFLPFDYGYFAFMMDREELEAKKLKAPTSLLELLGPEWKRKIILEDPRTSTPGLAFVLYAGLVRADFWRTFRGQWLTFAPGWSEAYGLFLKKEAPLVWSYTSSQAYHEEHGDKTGKERRYQALVLKEGNPLQIEGAALVRGVEQNPVELKLAREFFQFLVSSEVQEKIPLKNWMYPARAGVKLPPSFENLPKPLKVVRLPRKNTEITAALRAWEEATR